jgi:hypothetical protein
MKIFQAGAARREPLSDVRMAADIARTGLQPKLDEQDYASQIAARLIRNGQAHRAMRVEFPERFLFVLLAPQQAHKIG